MKFVETLLLIFVSARANAPCTPLSGGVTERSLNSVYTRFSKVIVTKSPVVQLLAV